MTVEVRCRNGVAAYWTNETTGKGVWEGALCCGSFVTGAAANFEREWRFFLVLVNPVPESYVASGG